MTHLLTLLCSAALDVVVTPWEILFYTPVGAIVAGILIAAVAAVTFLLIRRFYGKKKK